ncbi:molybdenum ABC transporter ATP-binding protein [Rhodanobacter aciditrophus]|uniref:Molybdenum ABC transporter ATP-binding protein n=1 Tax=Rhodanobacter aciditrophus TaxID=1623218 RepID=A0ABW4B2V4_9GAMM
MEKAKTLSLDITLKRKEDFKLQIAMQLPLSGITGIMGVSGSGKTTLLRVIAGLEVDAVGSLSIGDVKWLTDNHHVPVHERAVGYVFQEASLFPHLTVQQNLDYALKRAVSKSTESEQAHLAQVLGIEHLLSRMPHELSGGEKQRVAIARAIFRRPRLLLMDEPLAALDSQRKQEVLPYIEKLTREIQIPILYVSHSIEEVARISDRVVYLENGNISAIGEPNNILARLGPEASELGGMGTAVAGEVMEELSAWQLTRVNTPLGDLIVPNLSASKGSTVKLFIKANQVSLSLTAMSDSSALNSFKGRISNIVTNESSALATVTIDINGIELVSSITRLSVHNLALTNGMTVWATIKSAPLVR